MPIGFAGPALQGISLLSRFGIPVLKQAGIQAGMAAGMYGLGALADSFSKTPSQSNVPTRNRRANVGRNDTNYSGIIGSIPPSANGESYRDAELRLGNRGGSGGNAGYSTSTFNAPSALQGGGGFGGGGGSQYQGPSSFTPLDPYAAQNREYERERARVEAMVKANPDMQKQAIADERAKVRDQGMAIWAAANPTLAKQVKPGAVGYDAIQRGIGIQSIPSIENRAEFSWNQATQGPTPAVPMADAMLNPASPSFIGGEGPPPVNFADPRFENMSPEEFQKLLNQYTKR